jgi:hypothetical protein
MKFVKPETANLTFDAGKNPQTGDLDVTMSYREDIPGRVFAVSEWEVSDEELAEIIRTRRIYLSTMGAGMIPVSILAFDPFKNYGYYPAIVTDQTENGKTFKLVNDPRGETQFMKWMAMLIDELRSRDFFKGRSTLPQDYAPLATYRSFYDNGQIIEEVANSLERWIEHHIIKKN